jgi:hypothetical protein
VGDSPLDQVGAVHGDHSADTPRFGPSSDDVAAIPDALEGHSLAAMNQGLTHVTHGADLEHLVIAALSGLFAVALAVNGYFRHRMKTDLLHPVATMPKGS